VRGEKLYFSAADDMDDAGSILLFSDEKNKNLCHPCHLRLKNKAFTI